MTDERLIRLVARRVQQLRKERELTQEQMQDYGFSYRYYQRIEASDQNLTLRTLNRLAKTFDVPLQELLRLIEAGPGIETIRQNTSQHLFLRNARQSPPRNCKIRSRTAAFKVTRTVANRHVFVDASANQTLTGTG